MYDYLSNYSSHVRKDTEKELTFMKLMDGRNYVL